MRELKLVTGTASTRDSLIALTYIINDKHLLNGPAIATYESRFKDYLGVSHAVSFGSGRLALFSILQAIGIQEGDEVILPGYTCVVVPNAILYSGAIPVYVDIDPTTYNIDPAKIEPKITERTKAIIVQHTYGLPADIDAVKAMAEKHGLRLVEDCAHSLGAEYKGKKTGTFGDAAFFSTEQSKVISTAMGGMAVTNDEEIAEKLERIQQSHKYPDRGWVKRLLWQFIALHVLFHPSNFWWAQYLFRHLERNGFFVISTTDEECMGFKPSDYERRLTNAQAAIGINQLKKLGANIEHRCHIARMYDTKLKQHGLLAPSVPEYLKHIYLRYPLRVKDKEAIAAKGIEHQIQVGVWFTSVIHPANASLDSAKYSVGSCPFAEDAVLHTINFPTHQKIRTKDVNRIVDFIRQMKELGYV